MHVEAYGVLLVAIIIGVCGQLLLKHGMSRQPGFRFGEIGGLIRNLPVMGGVCCYGLSTVLYLSVLAQLELSLAYPTVSLGYVLVIIMSAAVWLRLLANSGPIGFLALSFWQNRKPTMK